MSGPSKLDVATALFIAASMATVVSGTMFTLSFLTGNVPIAALSGIVFFWATFQVARILRP